MVNARGWTLLSGIVAALFAAAGCADRRQPHAPVERTACLALKVDDKVWIPAGDVVMGSDDFEPEERPVHREHVGGFWIDRHEVTNAQFAAFVGATGYRTLAERTPDWPAGTTITRAMRQPGGIVFRMEQTGKQATPWWHWTPGANWRHPQGPGSDIAGREHFPVLQVAYPDALAYARWRGEALPTEAQWERAARGRKNGRYYTWGDDPYPGGKQMANTWQGVFPVRDTGDDGFRSVAPVGCFPPNDFGLYDMAGNVWEWTRDNFDTRDEVIGRVDGQAVTIRGGSWLCAPNYCGRFRPAARQPGDAMVGTTHIGFRTVRAAQPGHAPASGPDSAKPALDRTKIDRRPQT